MMFISGRNPIIGGRSEPTIRGLQPSPGSYALEVEEQLFLIQSAAVPAQPAAGRDDAVAGNDDRDRVGAEGVAGGSARSPASPFFPHLLLRPTPPTRHPSLPIQHLA